MLQVVMDVIRSHTYAASMDALVASVRDPEMTAQKYRGMGAREVEVLACTGDDRSITVESSRVIDVDLPGFARKVVQPTNTLRQLERWRAIDDGSWVADVTIEVQGTPIRIAGTVTLTPGPDGCTQVVAVGVTAKVPIIGGRIADWTVEHIVQPTIDAEFAFGDQWLAARPG
jgi:hypothetical protein